MARPMRTAFISPNRCLPARLAASSPSLDAFRCISSFGPAKAQVQSVTRPAASGQVPSPTPAPAQTTDARLGTSQGRQRDVSHTCFDASGVLWVGLKGQQPPDPNKAKLGRTLRVLQERLPTLLQSPLPQDILAPNISLRLFPSTHPHLPTVSGRVAYNAALWTSPIAWNRVPIIGNVKLEILAERMTSEPLTFLPRQAGTMPEQLVVRWSEKCKPKQDEAAAGGGGVLSKSLRLGRGGVDPGKAFTGLFIFDFDSEGRILTHTIEHAQEGGNWEKGMGAKFVGLTDWLLGGIKDPGETPLPMFEKLKRPRGES